VERHPLGRSTPAAKLGCREDAARIEVRDRPVRPERDPDAGVAQVAQLSLPSGAT
jgi:hypothetical protein